MGLEVQVMVLGGLAGPSHSLVPKAAGEEALEIRDALCKTTERAEG